MKKFLIIISAVIVLLGVYFIVSGFRKCPSAYIGDFTVSEDGTEMTLKLFSSSSVGFIRKVSVHQQHGGKLYLDCYCAFGGINGSVGAKSQYKISLAKGTGLIALYRAPDCYQEVLKKDSSGLWQRVP